MSGFIRAGHYLLPDLGGLGLDYPASRGPFKLLVDQSRKIEETSARRVEVNMSKDSFRGDHLILG